MLYVTGQRSGTVYAIELATLNVRRTDVCSEPIGVVLSQDGTTVYIACSQDREVVALHAADLTRLHEVAVDGVPWALAWSPARSALAVTLFQGPGVVGLDPDTLAITATWTIPDRAPRGDARLAHGAVRGLYDVAARPGSDELWVAHAMLGIDTPQPALDFERTAFPSLSILAGGAYQVTLSTDAQDVPGIDGSIADIVSGPHAIAFLADGATALVVDTNSEDVLAVDARGRVQAALGRPLPGHMPEGIAIGDDGT